MHGKKKNLSEGLGKAIKKDLGLSKSRPSGDFMFTTYPATVKLDTNGTFLVSFPDVPEADRDLATEGPHAAASCRGKRFRIR